MMLSAPMLSYIGLLSDDFLGRGTPQPFVDRCCSLDLVARNKKFCDDIDRSSNSACHNTAEGFYKFKHKLFAASLRIARGELGEARDQLESAAQKRYIDQEEHAELESLCRRALAATGRLIAWLENTPDP